MDGSDKELEEAVEKIINKREEKRRQSMGTAPIEKQNSVKKASTPGKKNKMKHVDTILLIIVIVGLLLWMAWPSIMPEEIEHVDEVDPKIIEESDHEGGIEPDIIIVHPANVMLDSFEDAFVIQFTKPGGSDGPIIIRICDYVRVIFELKNTGDEVATDVSCFIRCCDQNGMILFAHLFTFDDFNPNGTASDEYRVYVCDLDEVMYVTHNIDVRWSPQGTNTYTKITEI